MTFSDRGTCSDDLQSRSPLADQSAEARGAGAVLLSPILALVVWSGDALFCLDQIIRVILAGDEQLGARFTAVLPL